MVVEGTVRPPAPPANISDAAVEPKGPFHSLQPSPDRGSCSGATPYILKGTMDDCPTAERSGQALIKIMLTSPIEDVAPYKVILTVQM